MKADGMTKLLLGIIAVLLALNLVGSLFSLKPASAQGEERGRLRYMIAAWGVQAQNADPRSGYYVLDTVTGKVVAKKMEVHPPAGR